MVMVTLKKRNRYLQKRGIKNYALLSIALIFLVVGVSVIVDTVRQVKNDELFEKKQQKDNFSLSLERVARLQENPRFTVENEHADKKQSSPSSEEELVGTAVEEPPRLTVQKNEQADNPSQSSPSEEELVDAAVLPNNLPQPPAREELLSFIPHLEEMKGNSNLTNSTKHQLKFFSAKDKALSWLNNHQDSVGLFKFAHPSCLSFGLNDEYAFLHIFKNGGTSIAQNLHEKGMDANPKGTRGGCEGRKLVATVRDPIDHFLSGWAECGKRDVKEAANPRFRESEPQEYDDRIRYYLSLVKGFYSKSCTDIYPPTEGYYPICTCMEHSIPQANFLMNKRIENGAEVFSFEPQLNVLGDLKEMKALLDVAGFTLTPTSGRSAALDPIKKEHYPNKKELLSDKTLLELCDFLALDYYLFDFEPPAVCKGNMLTAPNRLQNESVE